MILTGNCCADISHVMSGDNLKIGITSSLNKVFQTLPYDFKGEFTDNADIEMALNEYEATQLVLFSKSNLKDIKVEIGPLVHENKTDAIEPSSIQINPIGYVYLKGGKKTTGRTGYHPDVILPNQTFKLRAEKPQPILITIYTPPETIPGRYHADISIKNNKDLYRKVQLNVLVHNIRIPEQPRFKSLSLATRHNLERLWPESQGYKKLTAAEQADTFLKIADFGFRNYLPPTGFLVNGLVSYNARKGSENDTFVTYPTHNKKTGEFDSETTDKYIDYMLSKGANSFFIGITSDIYKYEETRKQREETLLIYLDDVIPHLKKRGVLDISYLYNIDEPWGESVEHAKKIYQLVKQRYGSDIHVIQNTNQNNNRVLREFKNYFQAIDINLGFYNVTELENYRKKYPLIFDDVWWNLNLWPRTRPNLFLEYPLMDARIIGPMSFKYKIQGFEYWELTYIKKVDNYHPVAFDDFQLDWGINDNSLDGLLLYPNTEYGFYSSMRLASFRDGMEDLELLYLLQDKEPDNSVLKIKTINDIDDYDDSIRTILNFREKLFSALEN